MPPPKSRNNWPICCFPVARPHFGKNTWASSAKRSRMLPPFDVTPLLSNAFRYSSATDFRCSSVIVMRVIAIAGDLRPAPHACQRDRFWTMAADAAFTERRRVFRRLHESGCFVIPNPWDAGSARYLQGLGFKALATTSAGFAWSHGVADGAAGL